MRNFTLKTCFFLLAFFTISALKAQTQGSYKEKKMFFKIFLASEVNYSQEDADIIDATFNNAMFIYGCKTNIKDKITELHATDGLTRDAIIDFLSYTGKGYKVARVDVFEENK